MFDRHIPTLRKTVLTIVLVAIASWWNTGKAIAQTAQTPTAVGTLRSTTGAGLGTVEVFPTSTNPYGFWIRIRWSNGDVVTAVPFEIISGELRFWFLHYTPIGGGPNIVSTIHWEERFSGRISLTLAGATPAGISGTMFYQFQGAQNTRRIPITPVHTVPVVVTFP